MKPIFLNLMAYETTLVLPENFSELVETSAFNGLSRDSFREQGFAELCNEARIIESDGRTLVRYVHQEKRINKAARDALFEERVSKIIEEGREVSEEERWQLKEQIDRELLPYSPVTSISCFVLFCPHQNRIYLSCNSETTASMVTGFIRGVLGSLPVWPVRFCSDMATTFSRYVSSQGEAVNKLPKALKVDVLGALNCSGESGKKLTTANLSLYDDAVEDLIKNDDLTVRGIEMRLCHESNSETEADFKLFMPASGHVILKKFDYSTSADFHLDVCVANDEGDGGLLHQYTVEMLMVGRYAARIFNALAEFAGGYCSRDNVASGEVQHG